MRWMRLGESGGGEESLVLSAEAACSQKLSLCLFIRGLAARQCQPDRHDGHEAEDTAREDARHTVACSMGHNDHRTESGSEEASGLVHVIFHVKHLGHNITSTLGHLDFTLIYLRTGHIVVIFMAHGETSPSSDCPSLIHEKNLNLSVDSFHLLTSFSDLLRPHRD